jgi:hypothetical protein
LLWFFVKLFFIDRKDYAALVPRSLNNRLVGHK